MAPRRGHFLHLVCASHSCFGALHALSASVHLPPGLCCLWVTYCLLPTGNLFESEKINFKCLNTNEKVENSLVSTRGPGGMALLHRAFLYVL